jgi:WD40 repeat protein/basic membrane lipoprotein Med (substrate-binding protein (PBP1-ABC) superfamily)
LFSVAFNLDSTRLVTSHADQTARVWDADTGQALLTLRGHTDQVMEAIFSPDGTRLASAGYDGKAILWDSTTGQELFTLSGHAGPVNGLAFRPDCSIEPRAPAQQCGAMLATASADGTVKIWNTSFPRELLAFQLQEASAGSLSADGTRVAAGYPDGSVIVWDIGKAVDVQGGATTGNQIGKEVLRLHGHEAEILKIAFRRDGTLLATSAKDSQVKIWDADTGEMKWSFHGNTGGARYVDFSPDGKRLVTAGGDLQAKVWDVASGELLRSISLPSLLIDLAINQDGTQLAMGFVNSTVIVWDVVTDQELMSFRNHNGEVWSVAYSPDGTRLATGSVDRTAIVWDLTTGKALASLSGHQGPVNDVAFSPDGKRLATASQDGTARLWDATTGQQILSLPSHSGPLYELSYSVDGSRLFTVGSNGLVTAYLLSIDDLVTLARARTTRTLTIVECTQYLHRTQQQCQGIVVTGVQNQLPDPLPTFSTQEANGKACLATDVYGLRDEFYNQIAYAGAQKAKDRYGWEVVVVEPKQQADYQKYLDLFLQSGCDLIITPVGLYYGELVQVAAQAYPQQKFLVIEGRLQPPLANVRDESYATDQAAFLAGYVAASATQTGKVGTFGGLPFQTVTDFMNGFTLGVSYYNEKNGAEVKVLGWDVEQQTGLFTEDFASPSEGQKAAESLIAAGADILLPVAGLSGQGAVQAARDHGGIYLIGVDTDWTLTYPENADITLTSIEKRVDVSVIETIRAIQEGRFTGGLHTGTLENGGVSISPFHQLEGRVPAKVKADLQSIKAGIIAGEIKTKPGE